MDEKILGTLVSSVVAELVAQSTTIFKELSDEGKTILNTGLRRYLEQQTSRYSHLKTLLRGNTPVYIYDIYYPLTLRNDDKETTTVKTDNVRQVFASSNFTTIIGDAGSGKSTLAKHLYLNTLHTRFGIPVLIELRYLNDYNCSFEEYLLNKILESEVTSNKRILERLMEQGKFVFFLDGFDELHSDIKPKLIESLDQFVTKYQKNKYLLTSRPYSNIENLPSFTNYRVRGLSVERDEVKEFIEQQLATEIELSTKIVTSVTENKSDYIQSFLTNPLLLSLYILTFQSNASVPEKKYIFYRRVIQALYSEHDSKTKLGFVREKLSGLSQEELEKLLRIFCFLSYFEGVYSWDIDYTYSAFDKIEKSIEMKFDSNCVIADLTAAVALWIEDNGVYSFAHRSLQEYFAAVFIKNLNPRESGRIYKKIIAKSEQSGSSTEGENLLSLLEEMDHYSFQKFYRLPMLKELRKYIDPTDDGSLYLSSLAFFAKKIVISKNRLEQVVVREEVFRSIYLHLDYTIRLNHLLMTSLVRYRNDVLKLRRVSKRMKNTKDIIVFDNAQHNSTEETYKQLIFDDLVVIAREFSEFIDCSIAESNYYLKESLSTDKKLVDLI